MLTSQTQPVIVILTFSLLVGGCDSMQSLNKGVSRGLTDAGNFTYEDAKGHAVQDAIEQSNHERQ